MSFKVGDKVVLRKDSQFYGDSGQLNDYTGTVIEVNTLILPYVVQWVTLEAVESNGYSDEDLAPAKEYYIKKFKRLYGQTA